VSDAFEPKTPEPGQETVQLVCLGDGQANNAKLADALDKLADRVNRDAPGGWRVQDVFKLLMGLGWHPCIQALAALRTAVERFTDHETKLIRAKAEAEKLSAEAEAIRTKATADAQATVTTAQATAQKTLAEADSLRAEAAKKLAEAAQLQVQVGTLGDLRKKLKARGIDWQAEVEDGKMRVVVIKQPPSEA
jgi:hypothetical protein